MGDINGRPTTKDESQDRTVPPAEELGFDAVFVNDHIIVDRSPRSAPSTKYLRSFRFAVVCRGRRRRRSSPDRYDRTATSSRSNARPVMVWMRLSMLRREFLFRLQRTECAVVIRHCCEQWPVAATGLAGSGWHSAAGMYMPGLRALTDGMAGARRARGAARYTSSFTLGSSLSFLLGQVGPAMSRTGPRPTSI